MKLTNAALAELGVGRTRDPVGTFDDWRKADKPFLFVRSCLELYEAWRDPDFRTVLPIGLDATASGLQHLSLLCLDGAAGQLVNLTNQHYNVIDVYSEVAGQVLATLKNDRHEWAHWWLERLESLSQRQRRKLFKSPVMTFSYGAENQGWAAQIKEQYEDLFGEDLPRVDDKPESSVSISVAGAGECHEVGSRSRPISLWPGAVS